MASFIWSQDGKVNLWLRMANNCNNNISGWWWLEPWNFGQFSPRGGMMIQSDELHHFSEELFYHQLDIGPGPSHMWWIIPIHHDFDWCPLWMGDSGPSVWPCIPYSFPMIDGYPHKFPVDIPYPLYPLYTLRLSNMACRKDHLVWWCSQWTKPPLSVVISQPVWWHQRVNPISPSPWWSPLFTVNRAY